MSESLRSSNSILPESRQKYTFAIFNSVGVPIFSKSYGAPALTLPQLGLIYAVFNVSKNHIVPLMYVDTENSTTLWKNYCGDSLLFVITFHERNENISVEHYHRLLDLIYDCLVLSIGNAELRDTVTSDKISRQLRVCYFFISEAYLYRGAVKSLTMYYKKILLELLMQIVLRQRY